MSGRTEPDHAGVIAHPPLLYLGFLAVAFALDRWIWPIDILERLPAGVRYGAGGLLIVAAIAVVAMSARRFRAAGTTVPTNLPTEAIVTGGPYRLSRNPIYIALTTFYLGIAVAGAADWAILLLPLLLLIMNEGVIKREEAYLERKFGAAYLDYKARVRRWL
ncbi:methyltransferase family protein [Oceanibacterium hippocampi]|uniref:Isoprenylcysteine carboxyl methyltransferase (ICMT) family protein n=1 Tax=Oceanibacterium hippocampi TaxID=745714 RepID=A0A1Y5U622_9PROT|nr:isoprenylcysteine carboxylmethyltransferase family protein [Oceanibacterium hippocampi]SLN77685.1 hypothetical protein OCH7691_04504 [Oceanibacterium hippocampi]